MVIIKVTKLETKGSFVKLEKLSHYDDPGGRKDVSEFRSDAAVYTW